MLRERWLPWKAGLYGSEVVSLRGHYFWTGGLVYDIKVELIMKSSSKYAALCFYIPEKDGSL